MAALVNICSHRRLYFSAPKAFEEEDEERRGRRRAKRG
jgi:hypothetical protein